MSQLAYALFHCVTRFSNFSYRAHRRSRISLSPRLLRMAWISLRALHDICLHVFPHKNTVPWLALALGRIFRRKGLL